MRKIMKFIVVFVLISGLALPAYSAGKLSKDERIQWWRDARYGLFIHWGIYSVLGGEWQGFDYGKEMLGASAEWVMMQAQIPKEEYAALAKQFNPIKFNAKEWVSIAKEGGMKYIVITSKHHDGFGLFDSKMTTYDIMDASPFKRDIIKELADECKKQGMRFGVYYSHCKDWYHRAPLVKDPNEPTKEYQDLVRGQLTELLTKYGDMCLIWFDTGDQFKDINTSYGELTRKLQPRCLVSGRLGGNEGMSDYAQMGDRRIPEKRVTGDAETPMTMRDNWGYDKDDKNWKSPKDMIERLSLTVCRGANMLLNVGPKPEGTLCPEEIALIRATGKWLKKNGDAVYGTQAGPFDFDFEWGSISQKPGKVFLHVLKWNQEGIAFKGLKSKVKKAYILENNQSLKFTQDKGKGTIKVSVPSAAPGEYASVIVLEIDGKVKVDENVKGEYVWHKDVDIKLNEKKMEEQRKKGWVPFKGRGTRGKGKGKGKKKKK